MYSTTQDVEICEVPISKGEIMAVGITWLQNCPTEWQNPEKFIPERFDPESEYFFKPGTKKPRDPHSFSAFTFGPRNCLGQSYAKVIGKTILARFLQRVELEIDEEIKKWPEIKFNLHNDNHLTGKVLKIK